MPTVYEVINAAIAAFIIMIFIAIRRRLANTKNEQKNMKLISSIRLSTEDNGERYVYVVNTSYDDEWKGYSDYELEIDDVVAYALQYLKIRKNLQFRVTVFDRAPDSEPWM